MLEELKKDPQNKFYPIGEDDIQVAEKAIGFRFPTELRKIYLTIGYCFIHSDNQNFNRLMDPLSVRDFRLRANDFEYYPEIDYYAEYEADRMIFFEVNELTMLSIVLTDRPTSPIFYDDQKIADSLEEFLFKLNENDQYYY